MSYIGVRNDIFSIAMSRIMYIRRKKMQHMLKSHIKYIYIGNIQLNIFAKIKTSSITRMLSFA